MGHFGWRLGGGNALGVAVRVVERTAEREIGGCQPCPGRDGPIVTSPRTSEGSMDALTA